MGEVWSGMQVIDQECLVIFFKGRDFFSICVSGDDELRFPILSHSYILMINFTSSYIFHTLLTFVC